MREMTKISDGKNESACQNPKKKVENQYEEILFQASQTCAQSNRRLPIIMRLDSQNEIK